MRCKRFQFVAALTVTLLVPLAGARADEPRDPPPPRCEMGSCYDPLFTVQYPYTHSFVTSTNIRVQLPARCYDGAGAVIIGHGDLATMEAWTDGTGYRPIRTESGAGVAALAVISYLDTDIGPYDEAITLFVVSTEVVTIPDTPGAMLAALLDPDNRIWTRGLILDEQLPIDAGREYLFIPKEPDPKQMSIEVKSGTVSFDFAEPDGTPIASGMLGFDPATAVDPALGLASQDGTRRLGLDAALRGGNWRLRFVFRNIEEPETTAPLTGVGHFADPSGLVVARCCERGAIWRNPETVFGGDLAALELEPTVLFVISKGLRFVLDIDL